MKPVTIDRFPVRPETRRMLKDHRGVAGALWADGAAVVWGPECRFTTEAEAVAAYPDATVVWRRIPQQAASRVGRALLLMAQDPSITAFAAARLVGVDVAAVYRGRNARVARGACPTCGQVLPHGAAI